MTINCFNIFCSSNEGYLTNILKRSVSFQHNTGKIILRYIAMFSSITIRINPFNIEYYFVLLELVETTFVFGSRICVSMVTATLLPPNVDQFTCHLPCSVFQP